MGCCNLSCNTITLSATHLSLSRFASLISLTENLAGENLSYINLPPTSAQNIRRRQGHPRGSSARFVRFETRMTSSRCRCATNQNNCQTHRDVARIRSLGPPSGDSLRLGCLSVETASAENEAVAVARVAERSGELRAVARRFRLERIDAFAAVDTAVISLILARSVTSFHTTTSICYPYKAIDFKISRAISYPI